MRRAASISLIALSVIAAALAMIAAYAVSPIGRGALASIVERRLARVVGGDVEIGSLDGDLMRRVEINDMRFSEDGADWATIKRVTLDWSPGALLSRRIDISSVAIESAELLARPPSRDQATPFKGFELPDRLPAISVKRIELRNAQVGGQLAREALRLDGDGAVEMGGAAISVRARIKESSGRDNVEIDLSRETANVAPALKVIIASTANGAVATLLRTEGAVTISAEGSGPPTDYRIAIVGEAGVYGELSGELSADIETMEAIGFDLTASPGAQFDRWRADLGDKIVAAGALFPAERGARLEMQKLSGDFGDLNGEAEWRNDARSLDSAAVSLQARFSRSWRPDIQRAIGDQAEAKISIERNGRGYTGTASVVAPAASVTLQALKTDLRSSLSGAFSAKLSDDGDPVAPYSTSARAIGEISYAATGVLNLKAAEVTTGNGALFKGDASYRFAENRFDIDGVVAADSAFIGAFAPSIALNGGASGTIKALGTIRDFSLRLSLTAPAFSFKGSPWPSTSVAITLSELPASPFGDIALRSTDGSLKSFARIRRDQSGAVSLSGIDHRGSGYALTGDAAFNLSTREGKVDLRYAGAEGAEPWPGFMASGGASAKGALTRGRTDNRIDFNVSALRSKSLSLENATLTAHGPIDRLAFEAAAAAISVSDRVRLENAKVAGSAAIGKQVTLSLASAAADFQGAPVRLDGKANVVFGDGVTIDNLSVRVGDKGAIQISLAAEPARWRGEVEISDLEISAGGSRLDFDLALDTDKRVAATGAFRAAAGPSVALDATLNARYSWDGRRLNVASGGGGDTLDLDLDVPLALRRAERLTVSMAGALSGAARYRGRAETLALLLPLTLQSLEGDLAFTGSLGGTVKEPRVSGELSLNDGVYFEAISGLSIVDIDLTSSAAASSASSSITFLGSASGAGQTAKTITATGRVDLSGGLTVSADIALDGARFAAGPVERVDATGTIKIAGEADDLLVSGDVTLGTLEAKLFTPENLGLVDIDVVKVGGDGVPIAQKATAQRRNALRYAVRIGADDRIFVRGRGLDSEWRANAQLAGTSERPLFLGTMNLNRGDLEFSGRRFDLTRGSIGFDTLAPNDPTIDLRAEREARDGTTVTIVMTGRSSALKVSLESTPLLPSEDVMALILFDKPADELSALQSLQVADALTQLGGVGVFGGKGVTGAARDALGLDLLNLDVDQSDSSASLLTVGKYFTDGLFVSASQNARGENGSLRIEYEIGQSFSLETELRQDGDQTVSANWKKDF